MSLAALPSNPCIYFGLIKRCGSISRTWQTVFANSSSIKPYPVAQVLAKIVALILFLSVHYIMKQLLQKRFFDMEDEKIIRLLSSSLEGATLFSNQCS